MNYSLFDLCCSTEKQTAKQNDTCKTCGDFIQVINNELICTTCNDELGHVISHLAEWSDDGLTRCGNTTDDMLFNASISMNNNMWLTSSEKNLSDVFKNLKYYCSINDLSSNILDFAKELYNELYKHQSSGEYITSRGAYKNGIIVTCLLYALNEFNVPRSINDLSKMCEVDSKDITKGKKIFDDIMKNSKLINISSYNMGYADYTDRYCCLLSINSENTERLKNICAFINKHNILTNVTHKTQVCACIYFLSERFNLKISKDDISTKCDISLFTLTNAYQKLLNHKIIIN
jgi:transcription initiation factor TFIIIB Brf1 subunit/transcription initiation factor TFIIB